MARGCSLRGEAISDLSQLDALFQNHLASNQTEIWDIPIAGNVMSAPFLREAREKTVSH
jgi:hypothetical protein